MVPDLIYDIGLNGGMDTAYFLHRGFRVLAIDSHPVRVDQARNRFEQEIRSKRLTALNVGIGSAPAVNRFWIDGTDPERGSFDRTTAAGTEAESISVQFRPLESLLAEHGVPFFMKVGIDGDAGPCLTGLDRANLPRYLSVVANERSLPARLLQLKEAGFTSFKCISQYNFIPVERPRSAEQRRFEWIQRTLRRDNLIFRTAFKMGALNWFERQLAAARSREKWVFPPGSGGPFGEDTPGRWQTHDQLHESFDYHRGLMDEGVSSSFWFDCRDSFLVSLHAKT